ncbi:hypothetical protein OAY12_02175 [Candidatus Pelagibacter sp.]|nr:hypothetical protein [Candidatus Pelagibacter sp.]
MAKNRELSSIEHGLAEAIKNLKTEVIEEVTGKSESYIRKCSDPDLEQQLDHRDAIKIDKACVERGLSPYLLRSHEYIILKELKKTKLEDQSMNELLVQFTISLGRLLDSIKTARNPKGEKGPAISSAEKKEIYDAFHELENKILKVKSSIEKS